MQDGVPQGESPNAAASNVSAWRTACCVGVSEAAEPTGGIGMVVSKTTAFDELKPSICVSPVAASGVITVYPPRVVAEQLY
jgi:hypothetical protein